MKYMLHICCVTDCWRDEMCQLVWLTCSHFQHLNGGAGLAGLHVTTEKQRPQQEQNW